jgi:hypothetical protein
MQLKIKAHKAKAKPQVTSEEFNTVPERQQEKDEQKVGKGQQLGQTVVPVPRQVLRQNKDNQRLKWEKISKAYHDMYDSSVQRNGQPRPY